MQRAEETELKRKALEEKKQKQRLRRLMSGDDDEDNHQEKKLWSQEELLLEAQKTEEINLAELENILKFEHEQKLKNQNKRLIPVILGPKMSFRSSPSGTTLTFTELDCYPPPFNLKHPNYPEKAICSITGHPAKYFDPLTKTPYATIDAFKAIRQCFMASNKLSNSNKYG